MFMLKEDEDSAGKHQGSRRRTELKVARQSKLSVILVLLCLWGIVCVWGIIMYRDHIVNTSQLLIQTNVALEAQTSNQIRLIQTILMAIDGWLTQHPESPVVGEAFFDEFVHAGKFRKESGLFIDIYTIDVEGNVYNLSSEDKAVEKPKPLFNVDDRQYFRASRKDGADIFISEPVHGRISQDWVIPVVLPLSIPRNNMHMLMVAIKVDVLNNLYALQREPGTRIALLRRDGVMLAASHLPKEFLGQNYSEALEEMLQHQEYSIIFTPNTPLEKTPRLISYASLKEFPVVVMISESYYDVLKKFWKNFSVLIVLSLIASVAILLAGRQQMRLLIEQAKLHAKVAHMATTDDLTGIWNRRHFIEFMNHEFERSRRYNNPLSLLIFDLDNFKNINDTYGHQMGDETLIVFANTVMKNLRSVDFFARFGGEEFVVLLPQTSMKMARHLAERICRLVNQLRIPSKQGEISFSTSVGVAALQSTDTKPEEIIHRADKSLYYAKSHGRNQVGSAELEAV